MLTAGIDVGARNVKVVVLEDGEVLGRGTSPTGFDPPGAARAAMAEACAARGIDPGRVEASFATGSGRSEVGSSGQVTDVTADALGASLAIPSARTIIDVGAEEVRGMGLRPDGRVRDFVVNEKCAAGTGGFVEAMARVLDASIEEFGAWSLGSGRSIALSAQCVVFAESEVVGLVHSLTPREDIARAVMDAMASRIASLVRRIRPEAPVALAGGLAASDGFVASIERALGSRPMVPGHPLHLGALGAALAAARGIGSGVGR